MSHALLIVFITPKTGQPTKIIVHFYPDTRNSVSNMLEETNDLWITQAPYTALEAEDAPKLLKQLTKDL